MGISVKYIHPLLPFDFSIIHKVILKAISNCFGMIGVSPTSCLKLLKPSCLLTLSRNDHPTIIIFSSKTSRDKSNLQLSRKKFWRTTAVHMILSCSHFELIDCWDMKLCCQYSKSIFRYMPCLIQPIIENFLVTSQVSSCVRFHQVSHE